MALTRSEIGKRYRTRNRERYLAVRRAYYQKNREKELARTYAYLRAHPEVKSRADKKYRIKHSEEKKQKDKIYHDNNKARGAELGKKRRQNFIDQGLCQCGKETIPDRSFCLKCKIINQRITKRLWIMKGLQCNSTSILKVELESILTKQNLCCSLCPIVIAEYVDGTPIPIKKNWAKDHNHDCSNHRERKMCPDCFRGFLCLGCNIRMASLDKNPNWCTEKELDYMKNRPILVLREVTTEVKTCLLQAKISAHTATRA